MHVSWRLAECFLHFDVWKRSVYWVSIVADVWKGTVSVTTVAKMTIQIYVLCQFKYICALIKNEVTRKAVYFCPSRPLQCVPVPSPSQLNFSRPVLRSCHPALPGNIAEKASVLLEIRAQRCSTFFSTWFSRTKFDFFFSLEIKTNTKLTLQI